MACEKGYLAVVQKLVEAKADVNLCDEVSHVYIIIVVECSYNVSLHFSYMRYI